MAPAPDAAPLRSTLFTARSQPRVLPSRHEGRRRRGGRGLDVGGAGGLHPGADPPCRARGVGTVDRWAPTTPPTPTTTPTTTAAAPEPAAAPNKPGSARSSSTMAPTTPTTCCSTGTGRCSTATTPTAPSVGSDRVRPARWHRCTAHAAPRHRRTRGAGPAPRRDPLVAEENTNRCCPSRPAGAARPCCATLPGLPTKVTCHEGVDGIAWDGGTHSLVVPDPVTGTVYRISSDGSSRTALARRLRPPGGGGRRRHRSGPRGRRVRGRCMATRAGRHPRQGGHRDHARRRGARRPGRPARDGRAAHPARPALVAGGLAGPPPSWPEPVSSSRRACSSTLPGGSHVSDDKTRLILRLTPTTG